MKTRLPLGSVNLDESDENQTYFRSLPTKGLPGHQPRLVALELECLYTVTAGGTSVKSKDLYDALTLNMDDGSAPWGLANVKGSKVAQIHYAKSGKPIPYIDATGDQDVAANSVGATRRIRIIFSFRKMSPKGKGRYAYCPPCAALKGGSIQYSTNGLPANATAMTIAVQPYAHIAWVPKSEAEVVPRIRVAQQAFVGTGFDLTVNGLILSMLAVKDSTISDGDFTTFQLDADGLPVIKDKSNPARRRDEDFDVMPADLGGVQNTFLDPIGGNLPYGIMIAPTVSEAELDDLLTADTFNVQFTGALNVDDWTMVTTYVEDFNEVAQDDQATASKLPAGSVGVPLLHGEPTASDRLSAYLPRGVVATGHPHALIGSKVGARIRTIGRRKGE